MTLRFHSVLFSSPVSLAGENDRTGDAAGVPNGMDSGIGV